MPGRGRPTPAGKTAIVQPAVQSCTLQPMSAKIAPARHAKRYPTFRGWWIVFVSFLALFLHGSTTSYLFGLLLVPMQMDLGWSRATLTGALTVATVSAAGAGMLLGPLFDRHGARVAMTLSAIGGGLFLVLLAFVRAPWEYYVLLGLGVGAARAGLENLGPRTAIANWFVRRRAAAFAWASGGRALFGVAMGPLIAVLVSRTSWRSSWALMGVLELAILVPLVWLIVRRRPEDQGQLPDGDQPALASIPMSTPQIAEAQWTRAEAVKTHTFWYMVAAFILTGFPATGLIANMVPYFQDNGMSAITAAWAYSTYAFGAIWARPLWGYIAGRHGIHAGLTAYGFGYGIVIALFTLSASPVTLFLSAFPLGAVIGGVQQLQSQAWPDYFGRRSVGAITGLSILLVTPAMALGPLVAAFAYDLTGSYKTVFAAYAAGALVAGLFFARAKRPPKPGGPAQP